MKKRWQLNANCPLAAGRGKAAVGRHDPALRDIGKVGGHDLAGDLGLYGGVFDLDQGFDAAVQVAAHPIG